MLYEVITHIFEKLTTLDGEVVFEDHYPIACDSCPTPPVDVNEELNEEEELAAAVPAVAPRVIDPRNAFIVDSMLRDVIKRGTGRRARSLERDVV